MSTADHAWFECPKCGNRISYTAVMTRHLGSLNHGQVYAVRTPYCQCEGFPGQQMAQRAPERSDAN